MVDRRSLRLLLPRYLRALPADLGCMLGVTALVNVAVFAPLVRETPIRVPLGLVFVLFVPGYVFVAALFPENRTSADERVSVTDHEGTSDPGSADEFKTPDLDPDGWARRSLSRNGIDGIERVALSFGLSIAVVPLIGLALNFTPWGIRLIPIMIATTAFTLVTTAVAAVRRWELPPDERFRVPYRNWFRTTRTELLEPESRLDGILNVVLVLSILLAVGSVTFAIVVPPEGEQFSAIYLLTETEDGELVADDYPTEFTRGESRELVLGVDNHEQRTVDYTIVVLEQDVERIENGTTGSNETATRTVVTDQRELDRLETTLDHNESWHHTYDLEPTMTGDDVRVVWLLFPGGDVPSEPSMDDTEYRVHLWLNVTEPTGSGQEQP